MKGKTQPGKRVEKTEEKETEEKMRWVPLQSNQKVTKKLPKDTILKGGCDPCSPGTG